MVNASPLIFLTSGDCLDLLRIAGDIALVPNAVAREILQRATEDVTARAIQTTPWLRVEVSPPIPPLVQAWDLGPGEAAVLSLALARPGTEAIIDDRLGRRCAAALGIPVRGTLGLVLAAKRTGRLDAARPVVERLLQGGMYLSPRIIDEALGLVGE